MSKHTVGPWEFCGKDSLPILHVYAPDNRNVFHGDRPLEEQEANARLIAAAPELLAALKATFDMLGSRLLKDAFGYDWHEQASAAIAKATGEHP